MLHQRTASEFTLIVRRLWKLFRVLKVPFSMAVPKGNEWHFHPPLCGTLFESPNILDYVEMKMPMRSQESDLFTRLLEWNQPWGSPGRIWRKRLTAGLVTSKRQSRRVLPALRDQLENSSQALAQLQRPGFCSLIEFNPGLLLAFSMDITPWEDIST